MVYLWENESHGFTIHWKDRKEEIKKNDTGRKSGITVDLKSYLASRLLFIVPCYSGF